jgi:acyl-CoA reductase-like NAD-dependent aldehyde dehydrogenase
MTNAAPERRSSDTPPSTRDLRKHPASTVRRLSGLIDIARTSASMLIARVPGTMHATRVGAHSTTSALQILPDRTLQWLAASSAGLGAGFYLARAPRLVVAAGVAPALIMGAAIVLRPSEPAPPQPPTR